MNFLVICTGNTCRSPMAEGLLRRRLVRGDAVRSAGIAVGEREASANAVEAMREVGVDISAHRATQLTREMCEWADEIAVMSPGQEAVLTRRFGAAPEHIAVLRVPDPYGGDLPLYRATRDALELALRQWLMAVFPPVRAVPLEQGHIPALAEIERECFSEPWSGNALSEELDNPAACFLTAVSPLGEPMGYLGLHIVSDEGMIADLAVSSAHRRRGVGSALLDRAKGIAAERGLERLTLEVRPSNAAAVALYRREGFALVGIRPGVYSRPTEDAAVYAWIPRGERTP